MAKHIDTGKKGEALAELYFSERGYTIVEKNWRSGNKEIDIIAAKNGILHFIEVKTKTSTRFGYPEEEVSRAKIHHLINASEEYLFENPQWKRIQFDILSIILGENCEYFLIEDVYL